MLTNVRNFKKIPDKIIKNILNETFGRSLTEYEKEITRNIYTDNSEKAHSINFA